jgi:hypothetical protein
VERDLDADERQTLRLAALEFMVSLSEARAGMVKRVDGWVGIMVRACLEGMGEFEEGDGLEGWLDEDVRASVYFFPVSVALTRYKAFNELRCRGGVCTCNVRAEFRQAGVCRWGTSRIAACVPGSS